VTGPQPLAFESAQRPFPGHRWLTPRRKAQLLNVARLVLVSLFAAVTVVLPLWVIVINSFKPEGEAANIGLGLPHRWQIGLNYRTVWDAGHVLLGLRNTVLVAGPAVIMILLLSSAAAWVFARGKSRWLRAVYYVSIAGILLPPAIVTAVLVLQRLHVFGSLVGLGLFYIGIFSSVAIFLVTGFVKGIPYELEEAAQLDGAGAVNVFVRIILPLLKPILWTSGVVLLLAIWNDFFYPFYIISSPQQDTLMLGLYNFAQANQYEVRWQLVFGDVVLTSLPLIIVYFVAQRRIVSGLMQGAVKH
jgi:raffinose/stachyose/melibiose transport system permease protein